MQLAAWFEFYAHSLELNVWLSSTVTSVRKDDQTGEWNVAVWRDDKQEERIFHPTHVVFALGLISPPFVPDVPARVRTALFVIPNCDFDAPLREGFEGQVFHSSQYKSAKDHIGKKVVVVGTGASGHDISADCVEYGVGNNPSLKLAI